MIVRLNNEKKINFSDKHFSELKKGILIEIAGKFAPQQILNLKGDDLKEFKQKISFPVYKLYTSQNSFKLSYNQCVTLKGLIDPIQIHRPVCEKEYNQLLEMFKEIVNSAVEEKLGLEFNK